MIVIDASTHGPALARLKALRALYDACSRAHAWNPKWILSGRLPAGDAR